MKSTARNLLPTRVYTSLGRTYDWLQRLPELPAAYLHPWRRLSQQHLKGFKDIHRGERCFIIGNGPSLNQLDLGKLRSEFTFGMNRIYLLFPKLGFNTSYFVSINDLVIRQCAAEIQALTMPKFLAWRSHPFIQPDALTSFLYTSYTGQSFSRDISRRVWEGATVTYVALQIAFYMGFQQVVLIGVDHNFVSMGDPNQTVTSQGDDPNHFAPQYFGKGFQWQLPDLQTSELAYTMARNAYARAGRQVLDATAGGKLTIFPKADYDRLF